MLRVLLITILGLFSLQQETYAQACTTLGQTPESAFPVCGTVDFFQNDVPICGSTPLAVPGCEGTANYTDKNPFFYKFHCFAGGTLNFTITPSVANEDYDWQLYDVTGLPPNSIYTTPSTIVTGNWSGTFGSTGAAPSGVTFIQCSSVPADGLPTFARSPVLIEGHDYILMVSHFSDTQFGYTLNFSGGTAVITDPLMPHLSAARAPCDGQEMTIKLNKRIKCSSIAANGSDFTINSTATTITAAVGIGCSGGFDTDSLLLTLSNPLPAGIYNITMQNGNDANTLRDNCDNEIPVGETIQVEVFPIFPTPMDSVTTPGCAPQEIELVFRKNLRCSSIAANGSDFFITGPYPVTITGAVVECSSTGLTKKILVQFAAPLQVGGTFQIGLQPGTDGSTIIDECGQQTPQSTPLTFTVADTVNADFNYQVLFGCVNDTISYSYTIRNGVNSWAWSFDSLQSSTLQNPVIPYTTSGFKQTWLTVSNGVCRDTSTAIIRLNNDVYAAFTGPAMVCPEETATFRDTSYGNIVRWDWNFGNGNTSTQKYPGFQTYITGVNDIEVPVRLIVENDHGCTDTVIHNILVVDNCYIAVPTAFSPNGDGLNDYLYPLNAYKAADLTFSVYNRFGQRLFHTSNWTNKWDGTFRGNGADPGTYVWMLSYTNRDTNQRVEQKGTVILIR
jgi:gliding motility-associated-like protein